MGRGHRCFCFPILAASRKAKSGKRAVSGEARHSGKKSVQQDFATIPVPENIVARVWCHSGEGEEVIARAQWIMQGRIDMCPRGRSEWTLALASRFNKLFRIWVSLVGRPVRAAKKDSLSTVEERVSWVSVFLSTMPIERLQAWQATILHVSSSGRMTRRSERIMPHKLQRGSIS